LERYIDAKESVIAAGFGAEIDWQEEVLRREVTEVDVLRETAWVILSSGLAYRAVAARFPGVSRACFDWESATLIAVFRAECRAEAIVEFNHPKKIDAILDAAERIASVGAKSAISQFRQRPLDYVADFGFVGPTTKYHLAKNLGVNTVKPDRHLTRIAKSAGFESPKALCDELAALSADPVSVVDVVLWRFATLHRTNAETFSTVGS
jgi:hypothetical protein